MQKRNKYIILITLVLMAVGGILARSAYSRGFAKQWREKISQEFAKRGVYLDLEKLTLDPVRGLVARDVTVFSDSERSRKVAEINRITLDVDLSSLLDDEVFLDSIDLKNADLSLSLDPDDPDSERLKIFGFNSHIFLTGDRIQIGRAEGLVNGVDMSLRGLFFATGTEDEALENSQVINDVLQSAVRWIDKLRFDKENRPTLQIDIHGGDLSQPETLQASIHFIGEDIRLGSYDCDRVEAKLETSRGYAVLKQFIVEDESGRLDLDGEYKMGGDSMRFHLESDANLPGFLSGALRWKEFADIVFYEAPMVIMDGEFLLLPEEERNGELPLRATGKIMCDKITSRGKIFESAQGGFSINGDQFYLRDVVLEHRTGLLTGDAMLDETGFRYRVNMTMDPRSIEPFCQKQSTRMLLQQFEFGRDSSVFAEISGAGPDVNPSNWQNEAEIELRNFKFRGSEYRKFEAELTVDSGIQEFRDVEIVHGDSELYSELVRLDTVNQVAEVRKLEGDSGVVQVVRSLFGGAGASFENTNVREPVKVYADGLFDLENTGRSMMNISVEAGSYEMTVLDQKVNLSKAKAEVSLTGDQVRLAVEGSVFGGIVRGELQRPILVDVTGGSWSGQIGFERLNFGRLVRMIGGSDVAGGQVSGEFSFSRGTDIPDMSGTGAIRMSEAKLLAAPFISGLTDKLGEGIQTDLFDASASFSLESGVLSIEDLRAKAEAQHIRATAQFDFLNERSSLQLKVAEGESSVFPESGFREFVGQGDLESVEWTEENP